MLRFRGVISSSCSYFVRNNMAAGSNSTRQFHNINGLLAKQAPPSKKPQKTKPSKLTKPSTIAGFGGAKIKKKGTKGAKKDFFEYINDKSIKQKSPRILNVPEFNEVLKNNKSINADSDSGESVSGSALFKYNDDLLQRLHYFGAFQKSQFNELTYDYVSVLRKETLQIVNDLKSNSPGSKNFIITGNAGVGKSTVLSQVQSFLINQNLQKTDQNIILNLNNPKKIIDGSFEISYNEKTQLYDQPILAKKFLIKNAAANKALFSKIPVTNTYSYMGNVSNASTKDFKSLYDLIKLGCSKKNKKSIYPQVFSDFLNELAAVKDQYSIYFTVDNFNCLTEKSTSSYKSTNFEDIPVEKLQFANFILNSSNNSLFKGVIYSTTDVCQVSSTLKVALKLATFDPFDKSFDESVSALLNEKLKVVNLKNFTKSETKQMVDWFLENGLIISNDQRDAVDQLVGEKFFLSGGGNPRELFKSCNLLY